VLNKAACKTNKAVEPEQVNAMQLRDSRSTLAVAWVSTLSDRSCMVGLAQNLEVDVLEKKWQRSMHQFTFQGHISKESHCRSLHKPHQKASFQYWVGYGSLRRERKLFLKKADTLNFSFFPKGGKTDESYWKDAQCVFCVAT